MMRKLLFVTLALAVLFQIAHGSACTKQKDKPNALKCDDDGNFKKAQCNFKTLECFCVDPMTGKQKGDSKKGGIKCD